MLLFKIMQHSSLRDMIFLIKYQTWIEKTHKSVCDLFSNIGTIRKRGEMRK